MVHAGFALSLLDEDEAKAGLRSFQDWEEFRPDDFA
ncbi:MAG: hypothetical protein ACXWTH_11395 [Methylosarcina sp.]